MKGLYASLLSTTVAALVGAATFHFLTKHQPKPDPKDNPFTKLGALSTNGMVAEIFEFRGCYVLVQTIPTESGRAAVHLECP